MLIFTHFLERVPFEIELKIPLRDSFSYRLLMILSPVMSESNPTNFEPKPAKKKVKMNLACENDSGLKDTFKSINDTFNN